MIKTYKGQFVYKDKAYANLEVHYPDLPAFESLSDYLARSRQRNAPTIIRLYNTHSGEEGPEAEEFRVRFDKLVIRFVGGIATIEEAS